MNDLSPITVLAVAMLVAPFIGSFLSVLVVRLPLEEDVVTGRSHCRNCNKPLGPSELIPVLSWAMQRGKCSGCGASISALYPAMEVAATAIAFWACVTVPEEVTIPTILLGWVLLALAVMDEIGRAHV